MCAIQGSVHIDVFRSSRKRRFYSCSPVSHGETQKGLCSGIRASEELFASEAILSESGFRYRGDCFRDRISCRILPDLGDFSSTFMFHWFVTKYDDRRRSQLIKMLRKHGVVPTGTFEDDNVRVTAFKLGPGDYAKIFGDDLSSK